MDIYRLKAYIHVVVELLFALAHRKLLKLAHVLCIERIFGLEIVPKSFAIDELLSNTFLAMDRYSIFRVHGNVNLAIMLMII